MHMVNFVFVHDVVDDFGRVVAQFSQRHGVRELDAAGAFAVQRHVRGFSVEAQTDGFQLLFQNAAVLVSFLLPGVQHNQHQIR